MSGKLVQFRDYHFSYQFVSMLAGQEESFKLAKQALIHFFLKHGARFLKVVVHSDISHVLCNKL